MNTRKSYDVGAYDREIFETTEQGRYFLNPASSYSSNTCFQSTPEMHSGIGQYRIHAKTDMVDVETDLKNIIRKDSNDPYAKYPYIRKDYKNEPQLSTCKGTETLESSYPILEAPAFRREQSTFTLRNDTEGFPVDLQRLNRIRSNQVIGVNTRLYNRDTHVPKVPVLRDQRRTFLKKEGPAPKSFEQYFKKFNSLTDTTRTLQCDFKERS